MDTTSQKSADKISLIYEFNNSSPLFVRAAQKEMEFNKVESAIKILESGLKIYADNPVAVLLLGKAFAMVGRYDEALEHFEKGSKSVNSARTLEFYKNEVERIIRHKSQTPGTQGKTIPADKLSQRQDQGQRSFEKQTDRLLDEANAIEDRLKQLAMNLMTVKIPRSSSEHEADTDSYEVKEGHMIVSETLAKIYLSQGQFSEALKVYEKLIEKNPGKKNYYSDKIEKIRSRL